MSLDTAPTRFDLYIKLISLLMLPILIIIILIIFWKPIDVISKNLPAMIKKSETISIAGLTLKIKEPIINKPTQRINNAIIGLKSSTVLELIDMGSDNPSLSDVVGISTIDSVYRDLLDNNLVNLVYHQLPDSTNNTEERYYFKPTKLGLNTSLTINEVFHLFVQEITKPKSSPETTDQR